MTRRKSVLSIKSHPSNTPHNCAFTYVLINKGKHLQLEFTVEDEGAFTTPWSATVIYRPGLGAASPGEWPEAVCAENPHELSRQAAVPTADNPDF